MVTIATKMFWPPENNAGKPPTRISAQDYPGVIRMTKHFVRQIDKLKEMILSLGGLAEQSVENAIRAIEDRDVALARRVIEGDRTIDLMEVDVEEECLHTLALYQPVAADLRFVVSIVKINNELERIADLAVNLAEQAVFLADEPSGDGTPFDLAGESRRVRSMLKDSLDALVNGDLELAESVRQSDSEVDQIHRDMYWQVEKAIHDNPAEAARMIHLLNISRQLERIADHTVNIAEDVVYMARGEILRHSKAAPRPAGSM